jgi:hypothetical protein
MMAKIVHFIKQMHILCYINIIRLLNLTLFTRYLVRNYSLNLFHKLFYRY